MASSGGGDDDIGGDGGDKDVASMTVRELRAELQRYGISTESFFEKSEFAAALGKARAGGPPPSPSSGAPAPAGSPAPAPAAAASEGSPAPAAAASSEEERLRKEMEKCEKMGVAELKRQLEERGIPTASFFEKSDFVRALARDRAGDGGYRKVHDVEVITDDSVGPRPKQSEDAGPKGPTPPWAGAAGGNPFGGGAPFGGAAGGSPFGGGNPFGGAAGASPFGGGNPFGGAAGANPFGGGNPFGGAAAGGNPFGNVGSPFGAPGMLQDMMNDPKLQAMMSNPAILKILQRAQSNPRIMQIIRECVANPAAIAKYQNDPEFSETVRELQDAMRGGR